MWQVKGCPRCGGDVFIDRDHYGWYRECLQCGYMGVMDVSQVPKSPQSKLTIAMRAEDPAAVPVLTK